MEINQVTQNYTYQWWRWPLLPFASIIVAMVGSTLMGFFLRGIFWLQEKQGGVDLDSWYHPFALYVIPAGVFGYLYAHIACAMAPRGKVIAGTVMVTILGIVTALAISNYWLSSEKSIKISLLFTIAGFASIISSIVVLVKVDRK